MVRWVLNHPVAARILSVAGLGVTVILLIILITRLMSGFVAGWGTLAGIATITLVGSVYALSIVANSSKS
jgi:hypothetical protein